MYIRYGGNKCNESHIMKCLYSSTLPGAYNIKGWFGVFCRIIITIIQNSTFSENDNLFDNSQINCKHNVVECQGVSRHGRPGREPK